MEIKTRQSEGVTLLTCSGPLTVPAGKAAFIAALEDQLRQGSTRFVLDLREVPHMDSPTIGAMMSCIMQAIELDGGVKLAMGEGNKVREILELTGLARIIEIFDAPDDAMKSFGAVGA